MQQQEWNCNIDIYIYINTLLNIVIVAVLSNIAFVTPVVRTMVRRFWLVMSHGVHLGFVCTVRDTHTHTVGISWQFSVAPVLASQVLMHSVEIDNVCALLRYWAGEQT